MVLEMPDSNYKNLASVVLENAGTTSDTSITIASTYAANFPDAPFFATIMPTTDLPSGSNSEIVKVTASSTSGSNTTFTITRAQRGTSAISWSAGQAILSHSVYIEDVQAQSQGIYTAVKDTQSNYDDYVINNASAPTTPSIGDSMRVVFDTNSSGTYTVRISINGSTYSSVGIDPVYYGRKMQAGNTGDNALNSCFSGIVYELVYQNTVNGGRWIAQNAHPYIIGDDIAPETITKTKIAWSNLGSKGTALSGTVASGDSFGSVKTGQYNGAGTYVIIATATLVYSGSSSALPGIGIYVGTNKVAEGTCEVSGSTRINVSASYTGAVPANTYIYVRAEGATLWCTSGNLSIIRIGN